MMEAVRQVHINWRGVESVQKGEIRGRETEFDWLVDHNPFDICRTDGGFLSTSPLSDLDCSAALKLVPTYLLGLIDSIEEMKTVGLTANFVPNAEIHHFLLKLARMKLLSLFSKSQISVAISILKEAFENGCIEEDVEQLISSLEEYSG